MLSVIFIKIKFLTILGMVCMGLFSRLVFGIPALQSLTTHSFQSPKQGVHFPNGSRRSTLRFMTGCRTSQKRRKSQNGGGFSEDEIIPSEIFVDETHPNFLDETEISSRH